MSGDGSARGSSLPAEANITHAEDARPDRSVRRTAHQRTRTFVYELVNGRSVSHDVRVGVVGTDVTQIASGLPDGTKVVVPS